MEDSDTAILDLGTIKADSPLAGKAFFAVYDGHNGPRAADWCSKNVHQFILSYGSMAEQPLKKALLDADQAFLNSDLSLMDGCTAIMSIVEKLTPEEQAVAPREADQPEPAYRVTCINVGDSRCLLGRGRSTYEWLSRDHKPTDPEEMRRIEAAGGVVFQARVDGNLSLSRAMGDRPYKQESSLGPLDQKVIALPDIRTALAARGDWLLVCCDGLFERLTNDQVAEYVNKGLEIYGNDPAGAAKYLIDKSFGAGSQDNMSAVIVLFQDGTNYAASLGGHQQFVAGPFFKKRDDPKFCQAYFRDAKERGGLEPESDELLPKVIASEVAELAFEISVIQKMLQETEEAEATEKEKKALQQGPGSSDEEETVARTSSNKLALLRKISELEHAKDLLASFNKETFFKEHPEYKRVLSVQMQDDAEEEDYHNAIQSVLGQHKIEFDDEGQP